MAIRYDYKHEAEKPKPAPVKEEQPAKRGRGRPPVERILTNAPLREGRRVVYGQRIDRGLVKGLQSLGGSPSTHMEQAIEDYLIKMGLLPSD